MDTPQAKSGDLVPLKDDLLDGHGQWGAASGPTTMMYSRSASSKPDFLDAVDLEQVGYDGIKVVTNLTWDTGRVCPRD